MTVRPTEMLNLLQKGVTHHQAGRLKDAEAIYNRVIAADPGNANALNLLGTIAFSRSQLAQAKALYLRAATSGPNIASIHFNLANVLAATDDVEAALKSYERATALEPGLGDAYLNMGVLLQKAGRSEEAAASFRKLTTLLVADPRGHFNLGICLKAQGKAAEAEVSLKRAVSLNASYLDAHLALSEIYTSAERLSDALGHTRAALALDPSPAYHSSLGELLKRAGDLDAALEAHRAALAAKPEDPVFLHNYGATLYAARQLPEAERVLERAIALKPDFTKGYIALAKVYEHREQFDQATALLQHALKLDPGSAELIFKLSYCYLVAGVFSEGWRDYEYRFVGAERRQVARSTPPAYWRGEKLDGKTILIWMEQGPGDQILYSSMIPEIVAQAGHCIVECTPRLAPVFARSFPKATVRPYLTQSEAAAPADGIDYQIAVASLGQFLRPDFASFPVRAGYLKADTERTETLRSRYRAVSPGNLIVGLSWRSKNQDIGEIKSAELTMWPEILGTAGVTFVNLQYGDCAQDLADVKQRLGVEVFHDAEIDPLHNMDDFFAQAAAMDLVISTSNTTIHVAGSLNVPTLLMLLGSPADIWYWFRKRPDSPWYASLRILRGTLQSHDVKSEVMWGELAAEAAEHLRRLTATREAL